VSIYRVQQSFKYLILGSDGLWNVFENQEVCKMMEKGPGPLISNYVHSLMLEAVQRWKAKDELMDDISLIVIPLVME
jgi:serine/threonine protein phosphatase PrpC